MAQVTLITKEQIASRVAEMGRQITADYAGTNPIALCVLKGAVFFCSDLMRHIELDISLDFIQVSSYGNEKYSSGVVTVLKEPQLDMHGRAVLIVEDIIDSGLSMREVFRYSQHRVSRRASLCTISPRSKNLYDNWCCFVSACRSWCRRSVPTTLL